MRQSLLSILTQPAGIYFEISRIKSSGTKALEYVRGYAENTKADCEDGVRAETTGL
jgi:hypothetical protein